MRAAIVLSLVVALAGAARSQEAAPALAPASDSIPSQEAIEGLLRDEPVSLETWPVWRQRFLDWYYDHENRTTGMDTALANFIGAQVKQSGGQLPEALRDDEVAWLLHAGTLLEGDDPPRFEAGKSALQRAAEISPKAAQPHSMLAFALIDEALGSAASEVLLNQAAAEITLAKSLDARTGDGLVWSLIAEARGDSREARRHIERYLDERPKSESAAKYYCALALSLPEHTPRRFENVVRVAQRFPDSAALLAIQALALVELNRAEEASAAVKRVEAAGGRLADTLGPDGAKFVEDRLRVSTPAYERGMAAMEAREFANAEREFRTALDEHPDRVEYAQGLAGAILNRADLAGEAGPLVQPLVERFPADGKLRAYYAVALAGDQQWGAARHELAEARRLGPAPEQIFNQAVIDEIESRGRPGVFEWLLTAVLIFLGVYAVILAAMAGAGAVLALRTRGEAVSVPDVVAGQVHMTSGEQWLARAYRGSLLLSLCLFYISIPFVAVGVLLATGGLLYAVLMLPRIPVKLLIFIVVIGLGMAWAVIKSVFVGSSDDVLGLPVEENEHGRLWDSLRDVALKVGTKPIEQVYLVPGSEIGVRQSGRGPFGIFGQKRQRLILGLATFPTLTARELKAVLAHEYAHFSHQDTFYSRLIYQVTMSIEQTLQHMAESLGKLNYVNPFYWFFYLYYRAYMMLAAGFSRSREYLADRMAASLYGRGAFFSALHKVATEATLFEQTAHANIREHLAKGEAFNNIYDAFRRFRDEQLDEEERSKLDRAVVDGDASLFASHPTFRQRVNALVNYPEGAPGEEQSAATLLDDPQAVEVSMTELLTHLHHAHMQMLAQAG